MRFLYTNNYLTKIDTFSGGHYYYTLNKSFIMNSLTFREIYKGYNKRCTYTYKSYNVTESKKQIKS